MFLDCWTRLSAVDAFVEDSGDLGSIVLQASEGLGGTAQVIACAKGGC